MRTGFVLGAIMKLSDIKNMRVLFVTTKNLDYIRNTQEISLLKAQGNEVTVIGSERKSYPRRLLKVWGELICTRMKNYDAVFVGFAPQLVFPFLAKLGKKTLCIDFFISVYDTLADDRRKIKKGGIFARLAKWLDRKTIHSADIVVCDTNAHGKYFCEEFDFPQERIETLYLEADESIYYPREQVKPPEYSDDFVVLYFGSILPLQGVDVILGAIDRLKDEKNLRFVIVGPIPDGMKKTGEGITEYISWLSQEELAERISQADLCLAGHFDGERGKANRTIAGKTYIYRAMGKRIILGDSDANRELFPDGIYVPRGNSEALAEKILEEKKLYEKNKSDTI